MYAAGRTDNAKRNLVIGMSSKIVMLGATFLVRTVFIRILGAEYTGVNSLYTNILSILNLAELGFGSVFAYELYQPLRDNDSQRIAQIVSLFKKVYLCIAGVIFSSGILVIPLLDYIVKSDLNKESLIIYYILYLLDSVFSYLAMYRAIVIEADQKRYITSLVETFCKIIMYGLQALYLVIKKDFLGYLILQILFTLIRNWILHIIASKKYPYLHNNGIKNGTKHALDTSRIYGNVKATFISKVAGVILNQTDSIIISTLFGTVYVGYFSNYYMLITYLNSIYYIFTTSLEAGIGNLNAEGDKKKSMILYQRLSFTIALVNCICVAVFTNVVQDFITVWIGEKYLQGYALIWSLTFSFYTQQSMCVITMYRQTLGLFKEVQKIYPIMVILNIVLSILLGIKMGTAGVILATGIARLATSFWFEGKVVFQKLGYDFKIYIKQQLICAIWTSIITIIAFELCKLITIASIFAIIIKGILTLFIVLSAEIFLFHRTEEWQWVMLLIKDKVGHRA